MIIFAPMSSSRFALKMLEEEEELDGEITWVIVVVAVEHLNQPTNYNAIHDGFVLNHRIIDRTRLDGHNRLYRNYFAKYPLYLEHVFCRCFHVRDLYFFFRIEEAVELHDQ